MASWARYAEGIDELVILDITATLERRRALADTIHAVAQELFIPLAVGGGIRTEADAAAVLAYIKTWWLPEQRSFQAKVPYQSPPGWQQRQQPGSG